MKWSYPIARVSGIELKVHATFLLLLAFVAWSYYASGGVAAALTGVTFICLLFLCVLLHEFGHAFAARRFGIRTPDITLLPIGGVARLERMPENPMQELIVAVAGPAVNVVIAVVLWLALGMPLSQDDWLDFGLRRGGLTEQLLRVNVMLVVFNLIPAFPMDGGRALRALLATRMEYVAATQIAANVGQAMALGFGLIGLLVNPFLIFIALFVWIGAAAEAGMVQMKSSMAGIPVAQAMLTSFETLRPEDPLSVPVDMTMAGSQKDFLVVAETGEVVGILSQAALISGLSKGGAEASVGSALQSEVASADSHEMLEAVLIRLAEAPCKTVAVTHDGALVGMLTLDNVGELLRIQEALEVAGGKA